MRLLETQTSGKSTRSQAGKKLITRFWRSFFVVSRVCGEAGKELTNAAFCYARAQEPGSRAMRGWQEERSLGAPKLFQLPARGKALPDGTC